MAFVDFFGLNNTNVFLNFLGEDSGFRLRNVDFRDYNVYIKEYHGMCNRGLRT